MSSVVIQGDSSGSVALQAPAVAGSTVITLPSTSGTLASIASVNNNGVVYANATGQPTTNANFVFDGTNVGIGTTGTLGNSLLNVAQGVVASNSGGTLPYFQTYNSNAGADLKTWRIGGNSSGNLSIESVNDAYSASTSKMQVLASGNILSLAGGSTTATGTGISFPATQSASSDVNTLDDYEEGSWTPAITFAGASVGITYNTQIGRYVKIGKQVTVNGYVYLSSKGSSVGAASMIGLPFPVANITGFYPGGGVRFNTLGIALSGSLQFYAPFNSSSITFEYLSASITATSATNATFANTTDICFSFSYITDN